MVASKLPTYFHNINNRMAMSNHVERGLRETQQYGYGYMNPKSSLNDKKIFRVDPNSPKALIKKISNEEEAKPKKKATFEQLLTKYGYATEDKQDQKRKRPWHYKQPKVDDSSSSETE